MDHSYFPGVDEMGKRTLQQTLRLQICIKINRCWTIGILEYLSAKTLRTWEMKFAKDIHSWSSVDVSGHHLQQSFLWKALVHGKSSDSSMVSSNYLTDKARASAIEELTNPGVAFFVYVSSISMHLVFSPLSRIHCTIGPLNACMHTHTHIAIMNLASTVKANF